MNLDTRRKPGLPAVTPEMVATLKTYKKEIATYCRELPRLLAENQEGRYLLVRGDQVVGSFDTWSAAHQSGAKRFGRGQHYFVQKIDADAAERFAQIEVEARQQSRANNRRKAQGSKANSH